MKKLVFTFILGSFLSLTYAQSNLVIEYDESGNRINRKIIITPITNDDSDGGRFAGDVQEPISEGTVNIYPNPTRYHVNVEFSEIDESDHISYQLVDEQGRKVFVGIIKDKLSKIDLSNERNGNYYIIINRNRQSSQWQIVKTG